MRSDQLYVPPCFCAPTFASRAKCTVWAILGDRGLCYVLRLRRGAVLRVTALGSVCVTCYGFRWELCNTVLRVTAFWVCIRLEPLAGVGPRACDTLNGQRLGAKRRAGYR